MAAAECARRVMPPRNKNLTQIMTEPGESWSEEKETALNDCLRKKGVKANLQAFSPPNDPATLPKDEKSGQPTVQQRQKMLGDIVNGLRKLNLPPDVLENLINGTGEPVSRNAQGPASGAAHVRRSESTAMQGDGKGGAGTTPPGPYLFTPAGKKPAGATTLWNKP